MSKMKPPLPKSPSRLRPRWALRSNSTSMQTPPGSLTKSQKPSRNWGIEEPEELRSEYHSISCELRALAKMVRDEIGNGDSVPSGFINNPSANSGPLFERGRFYDEYTARRNERLRRKKKGGEIGDEIKTPYNLGVNVESVKRRDSKKLESMRKRVSAAYSVERSETPRYMLRSMSKDISRKPPLAGKPERSVLAGERKIGARRIGKF